MQTAIAVRSLPGPQMPGATAPTPVDGAAVDDFTVREDAGLDDPIRDSFAGFMADEEPDKDTPVEGAMPGPVMVENPLPAGMFWPQQVVSPDPPVTAEEMTLSVTGLARMAVVLPGAVDGVLPTSGSEAALVASASAAGLASVTSDQVLTSATTFPPTLPQAALPSSEQGFALPASAPFPPAAGDAALPASAEMARLAAGLATAQPLTALSDLALAVAGLRFWQASPVQAGPVPDPRTGPDTLIADVEGGVVWNTPAPNATASSGMLLARLAETALQSLFAAQAEASAQEFVGLGDLGSMATTSSTLPGAVPSTVVQATVLPHLAAQLAQTLVQRPDGTTEIALSPDELGHVRVTLQPDALNPDRIVVMLNFERPETLDLFRRHADQLAEALRDSGFAGVDIGFGRSDGGEGRDARSDAPADPFSADVRLADQSAGPTPPPSALRLTATGTLDLRL